MQRRVFELSACIGRGGFGEVYRATMSSPGGLRREVAIKVLKRELTLDEDAVARLHYEANLLSRLDHRAILGVVDIIALNGRVSLVTQLLDGDDLLRCVEGEDPVGERGLVEMCGEVAGGLHAAASNLELVHRDIKPSNIRITSDGGVKLLDFGIARSPQVARDNHTGTGMVVGTPGYIAPERFTDDQITPSSDIYSLGCVLFAGLTRRRLHADLSRKRLLQLALDDEAHERYVAERLREVANPAVAGLLGRMLQHDPVKRPSAREVEELCEELAPQAAGPSLRRWARAHTWRPSQEEAGELSGQRIEESPAGSPSGPASPVLASAPGRPVVGQASSGPPPIGPMPSPSLGTLGVVPPASVALPTIDLSQVRLRADDRVDLPFDLSGEGPQAPAGEAPRVAEAGARERGSAERVVVERARPAVPPPAEVSPRTPARGGDTARMAPAPRPPAAPSRHSGAIFTPFLVMVIGGTIYGFLALEGHAPLPSELWALAESAWGDLQVWWNQDRP